VKELINTVADLAPAYKVYFPKNAKVVVCEGDCEVVGAIAEVDGHIYIFTVETAVWILHLHKSLIGGGVVLRGVQRHLCSCELEDGQL